MVAFPRLPQMFPLSAILAVPVILQVTLAVGLTGLVSLYVGQRSVHTLAEQLQSEISDRVQEQLRVYLTTPQTINQVAASAVITGQVNPDQVQSLENYLRELHRAFPQHVNHISFGNRNGNYVAVRRNLQRNGFDVLIADPKHKSALVTYHTDIQGNHLVLASSKPGYNPTQRPWYIEATARQTPGWTAVYPYFNSTSLGISHTHPVYDATGNIWGIFATDFDLGDISHYLYNLKQTQSSRVFILDQAGQLVASSSDEAVLIADHAATRRLLGVQSRETAIARATDHLQRSAGGSLAGITRQFPLVFTIDGDRYFLRVVPLSHQVRSQETSARAGLCRPEAGELCWFLAIVIPEADFTAQLAQNTRTTLLLCLLVLLATVPLSLKTSRWVMQPILRRSEEKFTRVFHASPNLIAMTTLSDQKFVEVNDSFVTLSGYTRDAVVGRTSLDLNFWVNPAARAAMLQQLRETGAFSNQEYEFRTRQGDIRIGLLSAEVITIQDTEYALYVVSDITDRKRAEERLQVEQARSERLLRNLLPETIVERLKRSQTILMEKPGDTYIAEQYDNVTILFADIVGFTEFSSTVSPKKLVALLNRVFSVFDTLSERYGLEKIKTIGDAYMVAGGLPNPQDDHVERIADMALEMQLAIRQLYLHDQQPMQIRIGINTGSVVAGVIGTRKFIYDLWGDTVNVAHRMESQGEAGKIQVTSAVYDRLHDRYQFTRRGLLDVKGKGEMETYWLLGKVSDVPAPTPASLEVCQPTLCTGQSC